MKKSGKNNGKNVLVFIRLSSHHPLLYWQPESKPTNQPTNQTRPQKRSPCDLNSTPPTAVVFTGRPESRRNDANLTRVRELEVDVAALIEELKGVRGERDAMRAAQGEAREEGGVLPASWLTLMDRPGVQDKMLVRRREGGSRRRG